MRIALTSILALAWLAPLGAQERPNVLLLISDDQAWTDFGFTGHEVVRTPRLDRLAAEGLFFPRGYVPTSLCRASLATLVTGRYPHQHGITGNDPPQGVDRARMLEHIDSATTLPELLASAGYRSLQTGKWWEGSYERGHFTSGMTHGDPARGGRHGDRGLSIGRDGLEPIVTFIDECQKSGDPFFIWYAPFLPHRPHDPPERLVEHYIDDDRPPSIARYYAMCEWLDETVGELLDHLDERGITDETLVLFVVDNGWIQDPAGPGYAERSKRTPYEGGVRTPILARWPGRIAPAKVDVPVSSIDIFPTILTACGVDVPEGLPGIDLREVDPNDRSRRVFGASFTHDVVQLDDPAASALTRWVIEDPWKLVQPTQPGAPAELFDLRADPHEGADLASSRPELVAPLRTALDEWWKPGKGDEK